MSCRYLLLHQEQCFAQKATTSLPAIYIKSNASLQCVCVTKIFFASYARSSTIGVMQRLQCELTSTSYTTFRSEKVRRAQLAQPHQTLYYWKNTALVHARHVTTGFCRPVIRRVVVVLISSRCIIASASVAVAADATDAVAEDLTAITVAAMLYDRVTCTWACIRGNREAVPSSSAHASSSSIILYE